MSWFSPKPEHPVIRRPRQRPSLVVPSFIAEEGLVLNHLWHHGTGEVVRDYSGFGNHGTLAPAYPANSPTWVDGSFGWALEFDDIDDYVVVPDSPSLDITDAIMLMGWVNLPDTVDPARSFISKEDGTFEPYRMYFDTSQIFLQVSQDAVTRAFGNTALGVLTTGWQHVAATYDRTNIRFYRNAVEQANIGANPVFAMRVTVGALYIGIRRSGWSTPFNGTILYPRIYNIVSAPIITRHYESTRGIFGV